QRYLQLFRQRRKHIAHRDKAHINQRFADLIAALFLQLERPLQVFLRDQLALDEDFAQPHGVRILRQLSRTGLTPAAPFAARASRFAPAGPRGFPTSNRRAKSPAPLVPRPAPNPATAPNPPASRASRPAARSSAASFCHACGALPRRLRSDGTG